MHQTPPQYIQFHIRSRWCLQNWYVSALLSAAGVSLVAGPMLFAQDLIPERVLVGMLLIPFFVLFWAGGYALLNTAILYMDRRYGPLDGVPWPAGKPLKSYTHIGSTVQSSFIRTSMPIRIYFFKEGFGYFGGGSLRSAFIPWGHVTEVRAGFSGGRVSFSRQDEDRTIMVANAKPIEEFYRTYG